MMPHPQLRRSFTVNSSQRGDGIRRRLISDAKINFELSWRGTIWSFHFLYSTFVISVAFCKSSLRPFVSPGP